jgi:hypothetical protein
MSGLSGADIAQMYLNQQNINRAQQNYNYNYSMAHPTTFGSNTGVSNLGGVLASGLAGMFGGGMSAATSNLVGAQNQQAQLLGKALSNNVQAPTPQGGPQPSAPAQVVGANNPVVPSFAPQVGKGGGGGGGLGAMAGAAMGGMGGGGGMGAAASAMGGAGGASGGGGASMMGGMLKGMGGGGSGGGGSSGQSSSYTPPPPSFGADVQQLAGVAPGVMNYSNGQTAVHPVTGQQLVYRNGGWAFA